MILVIVILLHPIMYIGMMSHLTLILIMGIMIIMVLEDVADC